MKPQDGEGADRKPSNSECRSGCGSGFHSEFAESRRPHLLKEKPRASAALAYSCHVENAGA